MIFGSSSLGCNTILAKDGSESVSPPNTLFLFYLCRYFVIYFGSLSNLEFCIISVGWVKQLREYHLCFCLIVLHAAVSHQVAVMVGLAGSPS